MSIIFLVSVALGSLFTLFQEKSFLKINNYILKRKLKKIIKDSEFETYSEELVSLAIDKLRSKEHEQKLIGLQEIYYGWMQNKRINKENLIKQLLDICSREKDDEIRNGLIVILYQLTSGSEK